ncbi:MAG TPA: multicopper oxidase domain-containing protein, partial [Gemmatimonadales bacterium]|nr:multicopper oxidase domain-containing protein [Gemmatimonadales bacterium]
MIAHAALSIALVLHPGPRAPGEPAGAPLPTIQPNDNRAPAGRLAAGVLRVTLRARLGRWNPDGARRAEPIIAAAFTADGAGPTIPGPLIRVRAGTRIRARIVNDLPRGTPLVMHGLRTRPATGADTLRVPSGGSREVEFDAGAPGTYYYWAATSDSATIEDRLGRDSQLNGALIVDPADGPVAPDRVFVLGVLVLLRDTPSGVPEEEAVALSINGRSWPETERMDLTVGDTVHWRWINPTVDNHPMHMHGFFYRVEAMGSEAADTAYSPDRRRMVVTQRLDPGATMAMTWSPTTPGQWLMHCHIHAHTSGALVGDLRPPDGAHGADSARALAVGDTVTGAHGAHPAPAPGAAADAEASAGIPPMDDMGGLILGIRVRPAPAAAPGAPEMAARHRLRLAVGPSVIRPDGEHIRVSLDDSRGAAADIGTPGPPIVLTRGEPSEITVVNGLEQPTTIHWHGLELESYYDGVAGWSGAERRIAPTIAPGDSFTARMTPPRAGTFIYHAHNLATLQVGDGLVGPLLVLEPGERFDPSREIVWIVGGRDVEESGFLRLNGTRWPAPLTV